MQQQQQHSGPSALLEATPGSEEGSASVTVKAPAQDQTQRQAQGQGQSEGQPPAQAHHSGPSAMLADADGPQANDSKEEQGTQRQPEAAVPPGRGPASAAAPQLDIVEPLELVEALAAYAEDEQLLEDELVLHFFPFGGVERAVKLMAAMRAGTWPPLDDADVPNECVPMK